MSASVQELSWSSRLYLCGTAPLAPCSSRLSFAAVVAVGLSCLSDPARMPPCCTAVMVGDTLGEAVVKGHRGK